MPENDKGILAALLAVQQETPTLKKTATNPHFRNTYAPLEEIVATVNPILHKQQLVWLTLPVNSDYGPALTYRLSHVPSGDSVEGTMPLLLSKQDAQGHGSAITYARRYALCSVLNLVADDDDDGVRASTRDGVADPTPASDKQIGFLESLIKQKKPTIAQLKTLLTEAGAGEVESAEGWARELSRRHVSAASRTRRAVAVIPSFPL